MNQRLTNYKAVCHVKEYKGEDTKYLPHYQTVNDKLFCNNFSFGWQKSSWMFVAFPYLHF